MPRRDILHQRDPETAGEGSSSEESRGIRFPGKRAKGQAARKKRAARPAGLAGGLAPDAKRYNDEIPDPDSEDNVPE